MVDSGSNENHARIHRGSRAATAALPSGMRGRRLAAILAVLATFATGTIIASAPAYATDYPTWSDVAAVRNDESATASKIAEIEHARRPSGRGRAHPERRGSWRDLGHRRRKFQEAAYRADNLKKQADAAAATALASVGSVPARAARTLVRSGGGDITTDLFANTGDADNLLYKRAAHADLRPGVLHLRACAAWTASPRRR